MAEPETPKTSTQPGAVIAPGGATSQAVPPAAPASSPVPPSEQPSPSPLLPKTSSAQTDGQGLSWTASEFIAHEKAASWYASLFGAAVLGSAVVYLLTRDAISSAVVLIGALFLGIYAARKPRQLEYRVDATGIAIGPKHLDYGEFRSFSIVPEGAFSSIVFMPLKRFAATTTIYYAPEDQDQIINLLAARLPIEEHRGDAVDNLMRRIRF